MILQEEHAPYFARANFVVLNLVLLSMLLEKNSGCDCPSGSELIFNPGLDGAFRLILPGLSLHMIG